MRTRTVQRSLVLFLTASKKPESTSSKEKEFENNTLVSSSKTNGTQQHNTAIKFLAWKQCLKVQKSKQKYWRELTSRRYQKRIITSYSVSDAMALRRDYAGCNIFQNRDLKNLTCQCFDVMLKFIFLMTKLLTIYLHISLRLWSRTQFKNEKASSRHQFRGGWWWLLCRENTALGYDFPPSSDFENCPLSA